MKCYICNKEINGKYYIDQWKHSICASHMDRKEVMMCTSCGAFTTERPLPDGRCMCKSCKSTIVSTSREVAESVSFVKGLLTKVGFDFGTCAVSNIPVEIVSARKIAEIRHTSVNTNNKGVTSTETQMRGTSQSDMKVVGHTHKIYMLSDQPKIEFLGTLAHEMLHVWQNEHDIKLPSKQCEGLCNMGSYLVYTNSSSDLAPIYLKNLKESPDPIYGDGFRYVLSLYEAIGWNGIINKAKLNTL